MPTTTAPDDGRDPTDPSVRSPAPADPGDLQKTLDAFDALPELLSAVEGPDLRVVACNRATRMLLRDRDVVGMPAREAFPELDRQGLFDRLEEVMRTGVPWHTTEWRVRMEGTGGTEPSERYIEWSVWPWLWPDGSSRGVLSRAADVTQAVLARRVQAAEAADTDRRYREARDVIATLQRAQLPESLPVLPRLELAAHYLVAGSEQSAGGDWFDALQLDDRRVALVVGDVVGHGVAATAAMSQLRAVLAERLLNEPLADALASLDRFASARVPGAMAATVCAAIVDLDEGTLTYQTCGHPPPLVVAGREGRLLAPTGGRPLGGGSTGGDVTVELGDDDLVVLYSDGLVERPDTSMRDGLDTLTRMAVSAAANTLLPTDAPRSAVERVCLQTVEVMARTANLDDVTILAAQRRRPVDALHLEVTATRESLAGVRRELRAWLAEVGASADDVFSLELAVSEAVANSVEHGYADRPDGTVRIDGALWRDGRAHLTISDDGHWRPTNFHPGDRGRGLGLVTCVADDLTVDAGLHGTKVSFNRLLRSPVMTDLAPEPPEPEGDEGTSDITFGVEMTDTEPLVLRIRGPVDGSTANGVAAAIRQSARGGFAPLVIDLSDVTHLASAGVRALVEFLRDAPKGAGPRLVAPQGSPAAFVLDLVALDRDEHVTEPQDQVNDV